VGTVCISLYSHCILTDARVGVALCHMVSVSGLATSAALVQRSFTARWFGGRQWRTSRCDTVRYHYGWPEDLHLWALFILHNVNTNLRSSHMLFPGGAYDVEYSVDVWCLTKSQRKYHGNSFSHVFLCNLTCCGFKDTVSLTFRTAKARVKMSLLVGGCELAM
jgi:hypothetical protein